MYLIIYIILHNKWQGPIIVCTLFDIQATVVAEREAMVAVAEQAQPRFES